MLSQQGCNQFNVIFDAHHYAQFFVNEKNEQIQNKARRFNLERDEMLNVVFKFITIHWREFAPTRANSSAFVFGSLEAIHDHSCDTLEWSQNVPDEIFQISCDATAISRAADMRLKLDGVEQVPGSPNFRSAASAICVGGERTISKNG